VAVELGYGEKGVILVVYCILLLFGLLLLPWFWVLAGLRLRWLARI
jgi:hypothetical protein